MCNHYNRMQVSEVMAAERRVAEVLERVLAESPTETWGWSKAQMPVVYQGEGGRTLGSMRWGVWPYYEKSLASRPVVNARDDALLTKAIWKYSARERRCVAAADGFLEWCGPAGAKWEVLFQLPGGRPFFFAGVWSNDPIGEDRGFAIVTTKPNAVVEALPHDRMPVILDEEAARRWIGAEPLPDERLLEFCRPYPGELVRRDLPPPEKKIAKRALKESQGELL